ncbi:MAG: Cof-type HAD-IIB family hydrolase [Clostridiaceae bacterium]|nr:Cof-type HAD-IIB family hydrolase [Clostridiaceae bacterium]
MGKKAVFFDVDGTMWDVGKGLTKPLDSTVKAIRTMQEKGILVIVASAKSYIPSAFDIVDFDGKIFSNGSYIEINQEVLYDNAFSTKDVEYLMDVFKKCNAQYSFKGIGGRWVSSLDHPLLIKQMELFGGSVTDGRTDKWNPQDIHANMVTVNFASVDDLEECKKAIPDTWVADSYETPNIRMDIHLEGYSKGQAVKYLYEKLGINYEDTYAFGDSINDIDMLRAVKYGFAMGNANDTVKKAAFNVTDDVLNHGIYNALKRYNVI